MSATEESTAPTGDAGTRGGRRLLGALAGLVAAGIALGIAELVAAGVGPRSSPVVAVGDAAIPLTPEPVKEFAVRHFGSSDKTVLVGGVVVVLALYAVAVGLAALRSRLLAAGGVALFGVVGVAAAATRPAGNAVDGLPAVVGAVAGIVALLALTAPLVAARPAAPVERAGDGATGPSWRPGADSPGDRIRVFLGSGDRTGMDRRRFFLTSGIAVGVAVVAGGSGRLLRRRFDVAGERAALTLPQPASPAPALPAEADLAPGVPGLTPLVTGRDFYRVDTALTVPQLSPAAYRLSLSGMFGSRRSVALDELYRRTDLIERDVTLTCVSNEVGGQLAGTARWLGVPLGAFLRENGIGSGSTQLVCRSSDGMTIGASTAAALASADAMLAIGMNGRPLPVEHGFPVRVIIPGLYGYVSACKWLIGIEATTYQAYDAYWVQRGYAPQAPVKVESRIDTPAPLRGFPAGRRAIAGVAWAQTRGIGKVEVKVDDEDWAAARLSPQVTPDVWRQWVLPYDFRSGRHEITVRATTLDGETQTDRRTDAFPDGATGRHSIKVTTI